MTVDTDLKQWKLYTFALLAQRLSMVTLSIVLLASVQYWFSSPMHHQLLTYIMAGVYVLLVVSHVHQAYRGYRGDMPRLELRENEVTIYKGQIAQTVERAHIDRLSISKTLLLFPQVILRTQSGVSLHAVALHNSPQLEDSVRQWHRCP